MVNEDLKESHKILKNFEELSTFWIDLELDEFCYLFESIHETCLYAFEFEGEADAMPEDTFRNSIQKIFFKMQKYLNEEWDILTSLFLIILSFIFSTQYLPKLNLFSF